MQIRQHAVVGKEQVQVVINGIEFGQHAALEQLEHHQLGFQIKTKGLGGGAEAFADALGIDGQIVRFDPDIRHDGVKAARQKAQRFFIALLGLGDHAVDRQVLFQLVFLDQTQRIERIGRSGGLSLSPADQLIEAVVQLLFEDVFHAFALDAQFPHGVEIEGLILVVAGLVGQIEQGVIGRVEHMPEQLGQ